MAQYSVWKQIAGTVAAGLIVLLIVATLIPIRNGGLISWLGGATAGELRSAETQIKSLDTDIAMTAARFGKLELMIVSTSHGCGSPAPERCPEGWIDGDVRFQNTYNGGSCGRRQQYRLCIRAGQ